MAVTDDTTALGGTDAAPQPTENGGWSTDSAGRQYVSAVGRRGIIYRQGSESVQQAVSRDRSKPKDRAPRARKPPAAKPPPKQADLKELEAVIAEALKSPALVCAMAGDSWAAEHFTKAGPYFARNLVLAAEQNPWLRKKLEAASTGGDMAMQLFALAGVGGAFLFYIAPPLIWWFNLPVPDSAKEMLGVPEREAPNAYQEAA